MGIKFDGTYVKDGFKTIANLKDGKILKSQACIFSSKKNSKKTGLKNFVKLLSI